jgi:FxLD family lantipeptide
MADNVSGATALADEGLAAFEDEFNLDVQVTTDVAVDSSNCGCQTDDGCSSTCSSACTSA